MPKRRIKIIIQETGAPAPVDVYWKMVGANGRIFNHSELMHKRNAKKSIARILKAIKEDRYDIVVRKPHGVSSRQPALSTFDFAQHRLRRSDRRKETRGRRPTDDSKSPMSRSCKTTAWEIPHMRSG